MAIVLEGRRLVVAYNPHSSRARQLDESVFARLDAAGYTYTKLEVEQAPLADNVAQLAPQIHAGDVILSAAGDGSAHAIAQAIITAAQPDVQLGFLAYGNFNDIPRTFNTNQTLRDPVVFLAHAHSETAYPLTIYANEEYVRHALTYTTLGWTAQAADYYNQPEVRRQVQLGSVSMLRNLSWLGRYYLSSRRSSFLPTFSEGAKTYTRTTDILCANGPRMARLFRSGVKYYQKPTFLYKRLNVAGLLVNVPFLLLGLLGKMPGQAVETVQLEFSQPALVPMQCDGEVVTLKDVRQLTIEKSTVGLQVLVTRS